MDRRGDPGQYASRDLDEIERAWLEEAQRRAGRLERGEVEARDGDEVLAELEAKLQGMRAS